MRNRVRHDEPFAWWGPTWSRPPARTVVDLIRDGILDSATAGLLWALLARRASVAVVAGPRGAGKTTLLTALLDFLPQGTRRLYLRGCYEPFGFLDDPAVEPGRTALLVNEISGHLPSYLWGPAVRRVLQATRHGFTVATTAHAASAEEFVAMLAGYPLRVPLAEVAAFDVVVVLEADRRAGSGQRAVAGLWALTACPGGGLEVAPLAVPTGGPVQPGRLARSGARDPLIEEIGGRTDVLRRLSLDDPSGPVAVQAALRHAAARWLGGAG